MWPLFTSSNDERDNHPLISSGTPQRYKDIFTPRILRTAIIIGLCIFGIVLAIIFSVLAALVYQPLWTPAIILYIWCGFALYFAGFYCYVYREKRDQWHEWATHPVSLYWSTSDFSQTVWSRYVEEEFGDKGRKPITHCCIIAWTVYFFVLFTVIPGGFNIVALLAGGYHGDVPIYAVAYIVAFLMGIPCTYIAKTLLHLDHDRAKAGPAEFILNEEGFVFLDNWYPFQESFCCIEPLDRFEDMRVNRYDNLQHPCFVICLSSAHKGKKIYQYHRIPIPEGKIGETQDYLTSHGYGKLDQVCWAQELIQRQC